MPTRLGGMSIRLAVETPRKTPRLCTPMLCITSWKSSAALVYSTLEHLTLSLCRIPHGSAWKDQVRLSYSTIVCRHQTPHRNRHAERCKSDGGRHHCPYFYSKRSPRIYQSTRNVFHKRLLLSPWPWCGSDGTRASTARLSSGQSNSPLFQDKVWRKLTWTCELNSSIG